MYPSVERIRLGVRHRGTGEANQQGGQQCATWSVFISRTFWMLWHPGIAEQAGRLLYEITCCNLRSHFGIRQFQARIRTS